MNKACLYVFFFSSTYRAPISSLSKFPIAVDTTEKWQFLKAVVKLSVKKS